MTSTPCLPQPSIFLEVSTAVFCPATALPSCSLGLHLSPGQNRLGMRFYGIHRFLYGCGIYWASPGGRCRTRPHIGQSHRAYLQSACKTAPRYVALRPVAEWEGQKQSTKSGNANRAIEVQPALIAMLREHLNGRQEGLVFSSKNGKPLRNDNVLRRRRHPIL